MDNASLKASGTSQSQNHAVQQETEKALNTQFTLQYDQVPAKRPWLIQDTSRYSLVNAWNLGLFAALAYKPDYREQGSDAKGDAAGEIRQVYKMLRADESPTHIEDYPSTAFIEREVFKTQVACPDAEADDPDILVLDEGPSAKAVMVFEDDRVIIAMRGTDPAMTELTDVVTDLDAAQVKVGGEHPGYVHRGFFEYANAIYECEELQKKIRDGRFVSKKIYFAGHSLGGAGALVLATLFEQNRDTLGYEDLQLYTYGMPRALTVKYAAQYPNLIHYRHVNHNDIVPTVPSNFTEFAPIKGTGIVLHKTAEQLDNLTNYDKGLWEKLGDHFKLVVSAPYVMARDSIKSIWAEDYVHHGTLIQFFTLPNTEQPLMLSNIGSDEALEYLNGLNGRQTMKFSGADHSMSQYLKNLELFVNRWLGFYHGEPLYPLNRAVIAADIARLETEIAAIDLSQGAITLMTPQQVDFERAKLRRKRAVHRKTLLSLEMLNALRDDAVSPPERLTGAVTIDSDLLDALDAWSGVSNVASS